MLSLKSLLVDAGVISSQQADAVEEKKKAEQKAAREARAAKKKQHGAPQQVKAPVASSHQEKLKKLPKVDQYAMIRKWVDLNRLDKNRLVHESFEKYFFQKDDETVGWLSLEKPVIEQINNGSAAIMTYMSNNGLSNAVVPKEIAVDVQTVFPHWIRVLK